jgi:predicted deacylase
MMARHGKLAVNWTVPDDADERADAVERVFQGAINMLRGLGMLEGQIVPPESRRLNPPVRAIAPVAGYWSPAARPGQRIRVNDSLGAFRGLRGEELGDLLSNVSGIVLGYSAAVRVEEGDPLVALARPVT